MGLELSGRKAMFRSHFGTCSCVTRGVTMHHLDHHMGVQVFKRFLLAGGKVKSLCYIERVVVSSGLRFASDGLADSAAHPWGCEVSWPMAREQLRSVCM